MIEKGNVIAAVLARLKKLSVGEHLDVRSYKRDRSVLIIRHDSSTVRILERGFFEEEHMVEAVQLKKTLKLIVKREFPRSNKLRLYDMGPYEAFAATPRRKKI